MKIEKVKNILSFRIWNLQEKRYKWKKHPFYCLENKLWWWVLILASDLKENIVLVKSFRPCINQTILELPRWSLNKNEKNEDAALREFKEELWIKENPLNIKFLWEIKWATFILDSKIYLYNLLFENLEKYQIWWEYKWEYEEIYWKYYLNINEIKKLIKENKIIDSLTIAAIYKYLLNK